MSDYIISNGELYNKDELMHYGVPGMKWGKRKNTYVSAHKGFKNARKARRDAYNDSANTSGAKKFGPVVAFPNVKSKLNARKAGKTAYKESIKNDKAHNKELRTEKKKAKKEARENKFVNNYKTYLNKELNKVRKDLDQPYRQEIGNGIYANWPSKRKFLEAEIDRVTRTQQSHQKLKDYYIDGKQYLLI